MFLTAVLFPVQGSSSRTAQVCVIVPRKESVHNPGFPVVETIFNPQHPIWTTIGLIPIILTEAPALVRVLMVQVAQPLFTATIARDTVDDTAAPFPLRW